MSISIFRVVRDVEVEIVGDSFDADLSVGLGPWPEYITATRLDDGEEFTLTAEEVEKYSNELAEVWCNDSLD